MSASSLSLFSSNFPFNIFTQLTRLPYYILELHAHESAYVCACLHTYLTYPNCIDRHSLASCDWKIQDLGVGDGKEIPPQKGSAYKLFLGVCAPSENGLWMRVSTYIHRGGAASANVCTWWLAGYVCRGELIPRERTWSSPPTTPPFTPRFVQGIIEVPSP